MAAMFLRLLINQHIRLSFQNSISVHSHWWSPVVAMIPIVVHCSHIGSVMAAARSSMVLDDSAQMVWLLGVPHRQKRFETDLCINFLDDRSALNKADAETF